TPALRHRGGSGSPAPKQHSLLVDEASLSGDHRTVTSGWRKTRGVVIPIGITPTVNDAPGACEPDQRRAADLRGCVSPVCRGSQVLGSRYQTVILFRCLCHHWDASATAASRPPTAASQHRMPDTGRRARTWRRTPT